MSNNIDTKIRAIIDESFRQLASYQNAEDSALLNYGERKKVSQDQRLSDLNSEIEKVISLGLPNQVESFEKNSSPLLKYLDDPFVQGNKETNHLVELIKDVMEYLPWKYNYEERGENSNLGSYMGWAELIGPEAPYRTTKYCLGFTLISKGTLYPEHKHPAIEIYKVLSGTADWTLEKVTTLRNPGEVILHPSNKIHKMQTYDETLLALYIWSGNDVVTLSSYV